MGLATAALACVSGCDEVKNTETPTRNSTDNGSTSVSTDICTLPTTRIIDPGERATTGAVMGLRGAFSDVAQIPGTSNPGLVYTDAGAVALIYSFWNGTAFQKEVIAGGLTVTFPRLVYLSTGKPMVFWTNGATAVYMAVRSTASLTDKATWTVTAIENIATMTTRSLEASVNPLDQVAVFYVNAFNTSARVLLCSSNCTTAANYSGMGVVTNFITGTASATSNSADVKWCKASASLYYPYVTYAGTVNSIIARCTDATLANCLTPANWSNTAITDGVNATGVNQLIAKLHIDSGTDQPFNVVARRSTGPEMRAYAQNAGGCATGALAFNATSRSIISSANIGNAYGNVVRDSAGRWHMIVNDSTTSLRYFNELTGTITAAWNAVSVIETTTIGAASATRGGLTIDETGSQVLATYGRTAGGTPAQTLGNLVLAYNHCPVAGTGCASTTLNSPSSAAGMVWGNQSVDTTGQILLPTAQLPNTLSIATNSRGIPAVAYVDFSAGATTTGRLKYAQRAGLSAFDQWPSYDIASGTSPQSAALAFDHLNRPWIAYYDASSLRYYLTTNYLPDGSGLWITYQFPIASATLPTLPAANNVMIAMVYSGTEAKPLMLVSNSGAATKVVQAALFNPSTENWTLNKTVDTGTNNFSHFSSDFDKSGNIVVAYYDTTNAAIKYSYTSNGGTTWATSAMIITIAAGSSTGLSLRLNPSTSKPAIAYFDRAANQVKYKYCSTAISSCGSSANWSFVDPAASTPGLVDADPTGVSGLSAAATDGILNVALTFTSTGQPWVVYPTGAGASGNLLFSNLSSSTGLFTSPSVLSAGAAANVVTPVASTAANFAVGGWIPASVRTSLGSLHTVYVGPGNHLYVTSCGD